MKRAFSRDVTRRDFLKAAGLASAGCLACKCLPQAIGADEPLHEARFYEKLDDGSVRCLLCPWRCVVADGQRGKCHVRENRGGKYYSLVYGRPCCANNDPIEKKPFFHVLPGARAFSIATVGCNITCKFCQNWDISQAKPEQVNVPYVAPNRIAASAKQQDCAVIAYTYNEPTIFTEYMIDCAKVARVRRLRNVVVSNGFISEQALSELCTVADAIKIDFKAFSKKFYEETCGGALGPVLDTLKFLSASKVWFEIVVLVIPTLNDDPDEIRKMSQWIVKELGPDVPVHFTRFRPQYKIKNLPPTPIETVINARKIAMDQGCKFVYTGNMPGGEGENTYCPQCKTMLIRRHGMLMMTNDLVDGKCAKCSTAIPGLWS